MEVFVNRIPPRCTERDLRKFMRKTLADEFKITQFICEKFGHKNCGKVVFLEIDKGKQFLAKYGLTNGQRRPRYQLSMNGQPINCSESRNQPDEYTLRSLRSDTAQSTALVRSRPVQRAQQISTFEISSLSCGVYVFVNDQLTFEPHFVDSRRGKIIFGHRQTALIYEGVSHEDQVATRIDIKYFDIDTATTGGYKHPTVRVLFQVKRCGLATKVLSAVFHSRGSARNSVVGILPNEGTCFFVDQSR